MEINGRKYGSSEPTMPEIKEKHTSSSKTLNLGKVFGIMFIWLLITAGVSFGFAALFYNWLGDKPYNETAEATLYGFMIGSGILLLILTFVIQFFALKKGKGMIILSSIYVILMGILCSSMILFIEGWILGSALGISSAIFLVLAIIGLIAKNVKPIAVIGIMLIVGAALTALITWLIILIGGISGEAVGILWIVDFAMFGGMLLLIIVDMNQIGKICEMGEVSTNLTLYCALTLYTDFIYIFIKIAYYLAVAYSKR